MASAPNGIPDIMRGIGNMLRTAILEYNYKASQNELTKVLQEISGLKSDNTNLGADVNRFILELKTITNALDTHFNARIAANAQNAQLQNRLQDLQDVNTQLRRYLQDAQQNIAGLTQTNQGLQAQLAPLQQTLQQVQHQNQQQLQQLQQQLREAQAETAAERAAADAANRERDAATQARTAAEQRAEEAANVQQQAQALVAQLQAQLAQQHGASAAQVQDLQTRLETAQAAAQAAADEVQKANQARTDAEGQLTQVEIQRNRLQQEAQEKAGLAEATQRYAVATATAKIQRQLTEANTIIRDLEHQLGNRSTLNQQQVTDLEARLRAATSEKTQLESQLTQEQDAARQQIDAAQQEVNDANARAAAFEAKVENLQQELLAGRQLSQQQVATLNQQLEEAVQNANRKKEEVEAANAALQQQLDQQAQQAQAAAQSANDEKQRLTTQLADLQTNTGTQNAELQGQIAEIERQLAAANENAQNTQQKAEEAQQQLRDQLQQVRADADTQVAEAQRRAATLEAQLDEATRNGTSTTEQLDTIRQQLQQQQEAVEAAETARQDVARRAEDAEQASKESADKLKQQKVANTIMSAALKTRANEAANEAEKARQEAEAARTAAEQRVQQVQQEAEKQQSELAALRQQLETAKRTGQEVGTLTQTLAEKESELAAQKLAAETAKREKAELEEKNKAIEAAQLNASNQAANALNEVNQRNQALAAEKSRIEEELGNLRQQLEALQSEKAAAAMAAQKQADEERRQKDAEFNAKKDALRTGIEGAKASIAKMTDKNCRDMLTAKANELEKLFNSLNIDNITNFEKQVQDLSEATGNKIRTFVSMRKEVKEPVPAGEPPQQDNPYNITFDKTEKKITTSAIAGGGPPLREWGPFSGVFDPDSANIDKYEEMRAGLLDDIPTKGTTVVIFGYGYSGSGKTYTLLGGINNETNKWDDGIAQHAIQKYINDDSCNVEMEEVFEMYNDSYTFGNGKFDYLHPTPNKEPIPGIQLKTGSLSSQEFTDKIKEINDKRKKLNHIKATPNNRESSRGHLFIVLKVKSADGKTEGRLIICDMGGRENPNEMWTTSEYVTITKAIPGGHGRTTTVLRPVSKSNPKMYYDEDGTEKSIPKQPTIQVPKQLFGSGTGTVAIAVQATKLSSEQTQLLKMLKQGFYINDSINEMLAEFGYDFKGKGKEDQSNWSGNTYNPDVRALSVAGKIGIHEVFQDFREKSNCKIKFCTVACIRSPEIFYNDTIKTLEFARAVNSVILASPPAPISAATASAAHSRIDPSSLPAAGLRSGINPRSSHLTGPGAIVKSGGSGGSIRRQRRKKHAIFKTLKKSRLGSLALASDSASNSVKVKHKTRNKKKHNTRNNTVKK